MNRIAWNVWITAYGVTVAEVKRRYPPVRSDIVALTTRIDEHEVIRYVSADAWQLGILPGMVENRARRIDKRLISIRVPVAAGRAVNQQFSAAIGIPCSMPYPDEILIRSREGPGVMQTAREWIIKTYGISCYAAAAISPIAARIGAMIETDPPCIPPGMERDRLHNIPLSRLRWINRRNLETLSREWAVFTIGDLNYLPKRLVSRILGDDGNDLVDLIRSGKSAENHGSSKRIDLPDPSNNRSVICRFLLRAVDEAWSRLSSMGLAVRHIQLSTFRGNGRRSSAGRGFMPELEDPVSIGRAALSLLPRLLGRKAIIAVEVDLGAGPAMNSQLSLFPDFGVFRLAGLGRALAEIDGRFGSAAISRASTLSASETKKI